ncbi:MAG: hypothetical protein CMF56_06435 [Leifsonia sp.]|nr:hypothetical protein [Leifsonia sp.]|tara:strand:- start:86824 stop:88119 length:1296 start_codon:yes stop_codon:yes gene_type:complete
MTTSRWSSVVAVAAHARVRDALTICIFVLALAAPTLVAMLGEPGATAALVTLCVLASASLVGLRSEIEWRGILPVSLLAFFGWAALSVIWSEYRSASATGLAHTFAYAFLGAYVALSRDLIQLVRALGDALRGVLVVSLALEVLSGVLLDTPFPWLGIEGALAVGGPIQGVAGSRNLLAFIAGLAVLTFLIELRTQSVTRLTGVLSLCLAVASVAFSRSPVTFAALLGVAAAGLVLWGVRRLSRTARRALQPVILGVALFSITVAYLARGWVLTALDATADVTYRVTLWREIAELVRQHPVEGWGWVGEWPAQIFPYSTTVDTNGAVATSALNGYLDAWVQVGLVGLSLLILALGLGFVRAWLVASETRSPVNAWPALALALIIVTGLAESYLVTESGLVLWVAACMAAARKRSWRGRLRDVTGEPDPVSR